jgi:hypothetical protein
MVEVAATEAVAVAVMAGIREDRDWSGNKWNKIKLTCTVQQ